MPIDLTPVPFRAEQQFPYGLAHPSFFSGRATGPAPLAACLPGVPGAVLPNGVRNPYAPWAGETYVPAHNAAASAYGLEGPALRPRAGFGGGGGYAPASHASLASHGSRASLASLGPGPPLAVPIPRAHVGSTFGSARAYGPGARDDDGWDGMSYGRRHAGFAPDLGTGAAAGAGSVLGRSPGGGGGAAGWLHQPASHLNHARMTPRSFPAAAHDGSPLDPGLLAPIPAAHRVPLPLIECAGCASCAAGHARQGQTLHPPHAHHRSASTSSREHRPRTTSPSHRRYGSSPVVESPLRHAGDRGGAPLVRHASRGSERCSQCSRQ